MAVRGVDAGGFQAHAGGHQGVLAGAATCVQDAAAQCSRFRQRQEDRLRPSDVPRGRAGVGLLKVLRPPAAPRTALDWCHNIYFPRKIGTSSMIRITITSNSRNKLRASRNSLTMNS